jgi:hypothetical protein
MVVSCSCGHILNLASHIYFAHFSVLICIFWKHKLLLPLSSLWLILFIGWLKRDMQCKCLRSFNRINAVFLWFQRKQCPDNPLDDAETPLWTGWSTGVFLWIYTMILSLLPSVFACLEPLFWSNKCFSYFVVSGRRYIPYKCRE